MNAGYDIKIVEEQLSKVLEEDTKNKNKIKILKYSIAAIFLVAIISAAFFIIFLFLTIIMRHTRLMKQEQKKSLRKKFRSIQSGTYL